MARTWLLPPLPLFGGSGDLSGRKIRVDRVPGAHRLRAGRAWV